MRSVYDLAPVIADVISAHCPGTSARNEFMRACLHGHWDDARSMIEGMLAEPWHLRGYQEDRLREFLMLMPVAQQDIGVPDPSVEVSTSSMARSGDQLAQSVARA